MFRKRSQSSLEFTILMSFMILMFTVFFVLATQKLSQLKGEKNDLIANEIKNIVETELNLAQYAKVGYLRQFRLPQKVEGVNYNIKTENDTEIIINVGQVEKYIRLDGKIFGNITKGWNRITKKEDNNVYIQPEFYLNEEVIFFVPPTPANLGVAYNLFPINVTTTILGEHSSFINLDNTLVGWWRFDDFSPSSTADSSGNGFTGQYQNGLSSANSLLGKRGRAIELDGVDDYITMGNPAKLNFDYTDKFSLSAWFYHKGTTGTFEHILGKSFQNYRIGLNANRISFRLDENKLTIESNPIPNNEWVHFVAVYKNKTAYIYVNGVLENQAHEETVGWTNNYADFQIGDSYGENYYFNGIVDEAMVFSRALTKNEIVALYDSTIEKPNIILSDLIPGTHTIQAFAYDSGMVIGSTELRTIYFSRTIYFVNPTPWTNSIIYDPFFYVNTTTEIVPEHSSFIDLNGTLVGWWRFDNHDTGGIHDFSIYNNTAVFQNGLSESNMLAGVRGDAIGFTNELQFLSVGNNPKLNPKKKISVSFWLYPNTDPDCDTNNNWRYIFSKENGYSGYNLILEQNMGLTWTVGNGTDGQRINSAQLIPLTTWTHVVLTYDSKTSKSKIYFNGVEDTSAYYWSNMKGPISSSNVDLRLNVGSASSCPTGQGHFDGLLDEFMIFNRVLNDKEIRALFHSNLYKAETNFTGLTNGIYKITGYAFDLNGQLYNTETRKIEIKTTGINPVSFVFPTPYNLEILTNPYFYINVTTDIFSENSAFIDFNNSLLLWLRMDNYNSLGIYDESNYNYFASFGGGSSVDNITSGKRGYGMDFDGDLDTLILTGPIMPENNSFTISHWIKTNSNEGQMYTVSNAGGGNGFRFGLSGGRVAFLIGNNTLYTEAICGTSYVNDGNWHLITGVYDRLINQEMRCYIDGVFNGAVAIRSYPGMKTLIPTIGNPPCCQDVNGSIDEVMIFNRVLSGAEIKGLYKSGLYNPEQNFTGLKEGGHSFKAYAVSQDGNKYESEQRTVFVSNPIIQTYILNHSITYFSVNINSTTDKAVNTTIHLWNYIGGSYFKNDTFSTYREVSITEKTTDTGIQFPSNRKGLSCAESSINNFIYCFGGNDGINYLKDIYEYNSIDNSLIKKNAEFPYGLSGLSCAESTTNQRIYCFGGENSTSLTNNIFEYDVSSDTLYLKSEKSPTAIKDLSCVESTIDQRIYCFGGYNGIDYSNDVFEYDGSGDTIFLKSGKIPSKMSELSCVENSINQRIYCFGGKNQTDYFNTTTEYDPYIDVFSLRNNKVPFFLGGTSCAQSSLNSNTYCFGGNNYGSYSNENLEFNLYKDSFTLKPVLPSAIAYSSCEESELDKSIYCFGGDSSAKIIRYQPGLLPDEVYYYNITYKDLFGLEAVYGPYNFKTTKSPAELFSIESPVLGYYYTNDTISLNYTAPINVDRCWYFNTTGQRNELLSCQNTTFYAQDGSQSIALYLNTTGGNLYQKYVVFFVDLPIIQISLNNYDITDYFGRINFTVNKKVNATLNIGTTLSLGAKLVNGTSSNFGSFFVNETIHIGVSAIHPAKDYGLPPIVDKYVDCTEGRTTNVIYCLYQNSYLYKIDPRLSKTKYFLIPFVDPVHWANATWRGDVVESKVNNKIYWFGGVYSEVLPSNIFPPPPPMPSLIRDEVKIYDPSRSNFTYPPISLPVKIADLSCAETPTDNKIYCFGGEVETGIDTIYYLSFESLVSVNFSLGETTDIILKYFVNDPSPDIVGIISTSMPTPSSNLSCVASKINNKIYCFGGSTGSALLNQIVEFDPISQAISIKPATLPKNIHDLSCTYSKFNDRIYCIGGFDNGGINKDVYEYNPLTDSLNIKKSKTYDEYADCTYSSVDGFIYCVKTWVMGGPVAELTNYFPGLNPNTNYYYNLTYETNWPAHRIATFGPYTFTTS